MKARPDTQAKAARIVRARRRAVAAAVVAMAEAAACDGPFRALFDALTPAAQDGFIAELERQDTSLIDAITYRTEDSL